jgi:AcrR family transcriptional regulator
MQAALEVLEEDGALGLSASKIGRRAGLKPHLVHYYFRSMDDLVTAVVRTHGAAGLKNTARAIASDEPIRALWEAEINFKWGVAAMEFAALAAHRETIRTEMKRYLEEMRQLQTEAICRYFELRGYESPFPPVVITFLIAAMSRQLVRERAFDVSLGHQDVMNVVDAFLRQIPPRADKGAAEDGHGSQGQGSTTATDNPSKSGRTGI